MTPHLLDTHAFLWWSSGDTRLPLEARRILATTHANILISTITLWEIAIKVSIGKLPNPGSTEALIRRSGFFLLELDLAHVEKVKHLPLHHRDPFDRMLIAQSLAEDAMLISNEAIFDAYGVKRLWE